MESHLLQMRGLKLLGEGIGIIRLWSHLLQMRGLKPIASLMAITGKSSHLLQMRGLKHLEPETYSKLSPVASFTDAWIETFSHVYRQTFITSHLLQMRGLKLENALAQAKEGRSHLLQMRGLKPRDAGLVSGKTGVASFTDAWIETSGRR